MTDYTKPLQAILRRESWIPRSVFIHEGRDFVSDGHSLLLVPPGQASENQSNNPGIEQIIKPVPDATSFTVHLSELVSWLASKPKVSVYCDECDGETESSGSSDCEMCDGHGDCYHCGHECEGCEGTGKVHCPNHKLITRENYYTTPYVQLGSSAIAAPAAYEILSLLLAECGDEEITVTTASALRVVRFAAREWEYFQAPVRAEPYEVTKVWGK